MNQRTLVLYHRADFDGLFCREIAKKFLGDTAIYTGWDYGDSDAVVPPGIETIYMLDISIDAWMKDSRLIWIDHHKTAIEKHGTGIPGYQIDGVAACRLAWQWFSSDFNQASTTPDRSAHWKMWMAPKKKHFIDRKVSEPRAVNLAGEYDIWDKRNPDAELFQHGLRSRELDDQWWGCLLRSDGDSVAGEAISQLLKGGKVIQYTKAKENEGIIKAFGFTIQFEGFCLLACNAARYNSQLFAAGLKPEHDGCFGFNWDGQKQEWRVSLYSDKPGIDLSPVAVKYGGGGHPGACGFRCKTLPFALDGH